MRVCHIGCHRTSRYQKSSLYFKKVSSFNDQLFIWRWWGDLACDDVACDDVAYDDVAYDDVAHAEVACDDVAYAEVACDDVICDVR